LDPRTIRVLEYEKVRAMLVERAATNIGKEISAELEPVADFREVKERQAETNEARAILRSGKSVPLGGIHDVRKALERAMRGAMLEPEQFLDIADTIHGGRRLKKFLLEIREDFPILAGWAGLIGGLSELEAEIRRCINERAEVADDASDALYRIRRQIKVIHGRIRDKLESMIRSPETVKLLQDPIVTVREDRYVIPVRQEYRSQAPGIVHDQSASGATLFIEPLAVVEMNNDLRQLGLQEKEEILKILQELSGRVRSEGRELQSTLQALGHIDFVFAKGKLSQDMDAHGPELNDEGRLDIRRGRHPLLKGDVVPADVTLGKKFDTLVITGPNTGGKTVSLKTIGLLTLMTQAGLHIPAAIGTEMAVFEQVFCDLGDEQSIEQSLSTFSSHMTNIVKILDRANNRTLVLLDELGAGTDPTEGAALAMSILEFLHARGVKTVATTHYSELKTFAYTRPRVENASVEFDVETLRPTFRLLVGLPGRSNAFEISRRLGINEAVIERAREFLTKDELKVESLIESIQANRIKLEEDRRAMESARIDSQRLRERYEAMMSQARAKEQEIIARAQAQAVQLLNQTRQESEAVISELKEAMRKEREVERNQAMQKAREKLRRAREEADTAFRRPEVRPDTPPPENLRLGEPVMVLSLNQRGHVLSEPADGQVMVQMGIMKVQVKIADVRRVEGEKAKPARTSAGQMAAAKAQTISPEVDLRGLTADEAIDRADKYLDDATLAGLQQVRIIHGKGTGALRQAIKDYLRAHRAVRSFRLGGVGEGGDGVTVVTLGEG
jgi:DNA mismatch repair protein MutS2